MNEAQIELAWLADPLTCPYQLTVYVANNSVHVRGFVPDQIVRLRAVQLARTNGQGNIVDELRLLALPANDRVHLPAAIVRQAARDQLHDSFGKTSGPCDVIADDLGRITVTGTIGSLEEKLAVSRRLRQVEGCRCVDNRLTIAKPGQGGLSTENKNGSTIPTNVATPTDRAATSARVLPPPPRSATPPDAPQSTSNRRPSSTLWADPQIPATTTPRPSTFASSNSNNAATPPVKQVQMITPLPSVDSPTSAAHTPTHDPGGSVGCVGSPRPVGSPSLVSDVPPPKPGLDRLTITHVLSHPASEASRERATFAPREPAPSSRSQPPAKIPPPTPPVAVTSPTRSVATTRLTGPHTWKIGYAAPKPASGTAWPPAFAVNSSPAPHAENGQITFDDVPLTDVPPAPLRPVSMTAPAPSRVRKASQFATLTTASEPPLLTTSRPTSSLSVVQLKKRIESVSQGVVSDVQVTTMADHQLKVRLQVENAAQESLATEKVLRLPEMSDANVHLEFVVAPH
jgi:hypothetical protein